MASRRPQKRKNLQPHPSNQNKSRGRSVGNRQSKYTHDYPQALSTPAPQEGQSYQSRSIPPQSRSSSHRTQTTQVFGGDDARDTDDDEDLDEVVMAVNMRDRGTIGCAYYVAREEKLYFMEEATFGSVESVDALKTSINPTVILAPSRAEDELINLLDPGACGQSSDGRSEPFSLPYTLDLRPSSEFGYEAAKSKLTNLTFDVEEGPGVNLALPEDFDSGNYGGGRDATHGAAYAKLLRLSAWVTLESRLTTGCAGAVLAHLHRKRVARFLPRDPNARNFFCVSAIETFTIRGTMLINSDTLLSLQILQSESHPHTHNQGPTASGAKEGLSMYGLFHHLARTPQGKYMLRQYMLRPSLSRTVINERLDSVGVFSTPENATGVANIAKNLRGIVNVRTLMISLRRGISGGSSKSDTVARRIWSGIRKFTLSTINIRKELESMVGTDRLMVYQKIQETFDITQLIAVGNMISEVIDFEQSLLQHRNVVNQGIDEELDEQKRFYEGMDSFLSEVARAIAEEVPAGLPADLNIIFFPQIGFLISMPMEEGSARALWEGSEEDAWEKMFSSDLKVYYKNGRIRELDEQFGDVYGEICDKEIEIVHRLAVRVSEFEVLLATASDVCGELDCLVALAQGATQYKLSRPQLVEENVIHISGGRHLLQELTVPSYVPNDSLLVGGSDEPLDFQRLQPEDDQTEGTAAPRKMNSPMERPSMMILTGPNYSGKSVHLKQIALIVYLAHIGSFVPAEAARIGLTDKILTRVSTRETVSKVQSAFMVDLQQINLALSLATSRSLLIIDEFGKGTNTTDGAGLVCGVFEYLLSLGNGCPKVLAATHFHEIFESGFLRPRSMLQFAHMQVQVDQEAGDVTYLYNLCEGRSTESFGTCCARMNGVSAKIVERAEELSLMVARGEDLVTACGAMSRDESAELEAAERVARDFLASELSSDPGQVLAAILDDEQS